MDTTISNSVVNIQMTILREQKILAFYWLLLDFQSLSRGFLFSVISFLSEAEIQKRKFEPNFTKM